MRRSTAVFCLGLAAVALMGVKRPNGLADVLAVRHWSYPDVESFLHPPEYELFDLQKDPHEWKNRADSPQHKATKQRLLKAMQEFQRRIKDPFADRNNIATFIAEQKEYQQKPYKNPGFRWPHLDMFKQAQEAAR